MRSVVILHDSANQRPWVAVDRLSSSELLRLQNRDQLAKVCARLGWEISVVKPQSKTIAVERRAAPRTTGSGQIVLSTPHLVTMRKRRRGRPAQGS
jgi:hypothetical protein